MNRDDLRRVMPPETYRRFIGIEIDPGYFKISHRRILDAAPLFVRPQETRDGQG
jgi:hypothetical protein